MSEQRTRQLYEGGQVYPTGAVSRPAGATGDDYAGRLLARKLDLVAAAIQPGTLVDLCCATGSHLDAFFDRASYCVGIDFSLPFLQHARTTYAPRVDFIAADARALPLADASVATLYSLSALYQVPELPRVIGEVARVLRRGGRCVLDLGNAHSLNAYCVRRHYPELPESHYCSVADMLALCAANGLRVIGHHAFQLLPLWADRPRWLRPLLHPLWRRIMRLRIGERMLDERLSSLPGLRRLAFRQILVCERC